MLTASLRLPTYTISYLCYDRAFFFKFFIHVHHFSLKGYFQISEQMYSYSNLVFFSSSHLWVNKLHVSLSWKTFTVWHLVFHIECALNSAVSNVKKKFSPWLLFSSTQVTDHRIGLVLIQKCLDTDSLIFPQRGMWRNGENFNHRSNQSLRVGF